jgi:hypothetical protein
MARKRVVLNAHTAREIECLAPSYAQSMRRGVKSQLSNMLALRFGVDAKTIRDIWNRKTWTDGNGTAQRIADSFISNEPAYDMLGEWDSNLSIDNLLEMNI